MKKPKINTMEELSAALGISRPTLSRFFHDPASVRGSTSDKIKRGLAQVDYVPNFFATRMNRKQSGLIGVIIPHLKDLFFASLLDVIEVAAMEAGFTIITQSSHGDPSLEARAADTLLSMSADGAIVAPLGADSHIDALARLRTRVPFVFVDSEMPETLPGVAHVGTNNRQSIGLITHYLCRTGDPPAFLGMPRLNSNSLEREAAYIATMDEAGEKPHIISRPITSDGWAFEAYAYTIMNDLFSRGQFTNGTLLCANDRLAIGASRAAHHHSLFSGGSAHEQCFRIAGHDDHPLSRFMTPSLTTVAQDIHSIGQAAVTTLLAQINGIDEPDDRPRDRTFDAVLKVRESA